MGAIANTATARRDLVLYGASAAFAAITAATSTLLPHREWGAVAWWGYAAAFLLVAFTRRRLLLTAAVFVTSTLVPLLVEAVQRAGGRTDRAQEEVLVVEHMATRLLSSGTPYLSRDEIAALPASSQLLGYAPYQPGMAVFGLPRAVFGTFWWTDARVWFAAATIGALIWTLRLLNGVTTESGRLLVAQSVAVLPICALTLSTGGDDLPVLTLSLLAVACRARGRWGAAGLAIGLAATLKLFAVPVLVVLVVLAARSGARTCARLLAGGAGLPMLAMVPALLIAPSAFVENVLRFPLGRGLVTSPARSPLPGRLIATSFDGGGTVALALLLAAALTIGWWLLRSPPPDAALVVTVGLTAAIMLLPSTRFGYLLYPAAFAALWWALREQRIDMRHDDT